MSKSNLKYEWLLFDADGTLFDFWHAEENALRNLFNLFHFNFKSEHLSQFRAIDSKLWVDIEKSKFDVSLLSLKRFKILVEHFELKCDSLKFSNSYLEFLSKETKLINNAEEVIALLSQKYKLMIITNGNKKVQRSRFDNSAIGKYFHDYVISNEVDAVKPEKKIFDICFERMGCPSKDKVLLVGDSLTADINGGISYEIDTCWFNPDHGKSESGQGIKFVINSLDELIKILM